MLSFFLNELPGRTSILYKPKIGIRIAGFHRPKGLQILASSESLIGFKS